MITGALGCTETVEGVGSPLAAGDGDGLGLVDLRRFKGRGGGIVTGVGGFTGRLLFKRVGGVGGVGAFGSRRRRRAATVGPSVLACLLRFGGRVGRWGPDDDDDDDDDGSVLEWCGRTAARWCLYVSF